MEDVNLHFTGDLHAITAANNLLAALLDAHLLHGNELDIDPAAVSWRRCTDTNDRGLRHIVTGLGGRLNGAPRETGFDITAASEVMGIVAVARDLHDLRARLGAITVARTFEGEPVTAEAIGAAGAMTVLLKEAIRPNLVQTLEQRPALVHAGPFANISTGNNSLVADRVALKLGDTVVTESGFGSDCGLEKLFDIVCRLGGLAPSAVVLVVTVPTLAEHGGGREGGTAAIERGAANLERHVQIVRGFGLEPVVAVNRHPGDTPAEVELARRLAMEAGAFAAEACDGYEQGGAGAVALAEAVVEATGRAPVLTPAYELSDPLEEKVSKIATRVYGAADVHFEPEARRTLEALGADGLGGLPVCMAKTQLSLGHDPALGSTPEDFTLVVRDLRAYTGAGWVVALCGGMLTMPGLGAHPAAHRIDIDDEGRTVGLF